MCECVHELYLHRLRFTSWRRHRRLPGEREDWCYNSRRRYPRWGARLSTTATRSTITAAGSLTVPAPPPLSYWMKAGVLANFQTSLNCRWVTYQLPRNSLKVKTTEAWPHLQKIWNTPYTRSTRKTFPLTLPPQSQCWQPLLSLKQLRLNKRMKGTGR